MLVVFCAGRTVTAAVCVIENGHGTYVVGELTWAQLRAHLSKIDAAYGVYYTQAERMRTETYLEEMEKTGIQVEIEAERHYELDLSIKFPRRADIVEGALIQQLKRIRGLTVEKHRTMLNVKHLERMRQRTGYIVRKEGDDALS